LASQEADKQRKIAQASEKTAKWRLHASNIASAQRVWERNDVSLFYHFLEQWHQGFCGLGDDYLYTLANRKQQTFRGHTDAVSNGAFSPDGKRLASASGDLPKNFGELKLWDTVTGRLLLTLGQTGSIHSLAFSPDGKRLASASNGIPKNSYEVILWDSMS